MVNSRMRRYGTQAKGTVSRGKGRLDVYTMPRVSVPFPKEVFAALRTRAVTERVSVAEVVRALVVAAL